MLIKDAIEKVVVGHIQILGESSVKDLLKKFNGVEINDGEVNVLRANDKDLKDICLAFKPITGEISHQLLKYL